MKCAYFPCLSEATDEYPCCSAEHGFKFEQNVNQMKRYKKGEKVELYNLRGITKTPWTIEEAIYYGKF